MEVHHVGAVHRQLPMSDVVHPVDGADQGGLARAGQADDGHELPLVNGQVDVFQGFISIGVALLYLFELNHNISLHFKGGRKAAASLPRLSSMFDWV